MDSERFPEHQARGSQLGKLKPFVTHINQCFTQGCHNINQLWREVQAQGYEGKRAMVKRYVHYLKRLTEEQLHALSSPIFRKPTPKVLSYELLKRQASRSPNIQQLLKQLLEVSCDFTEFETKSTAFSKMIKQRESDTFIEWLEQSKQSSITILKNFALNLQKDKEAIHNAMKYHWSNGQLEGQVNRLKTIKRQMYGRANFDLLRAKVLYDSG